MCVLNLCVCFVYAIFSCCIQFLSLFEICVMWYYDFDVPYCLGFEYAFKMAEHVHPTLAFYVIYSIIFSYLYFYSTISEEVVIFTQIICRDNCRKHFTLDLALKFCLHLKINYDNSAML